MRVLSYSLAVALAVVLAGVAAQAQERMLAHDVYFSLKDNSPQAKAKLVADCKKYLLDYPGMVLFSVGPLAEELKRDVNDQDFDVALHIVFANKAVHDQYQKSERHLSLIAENKANLKKLRVFDSYVEAFAHATGDKRPGGQSRVPGPGTGLWARTQANTAATIQVRLLKTAIEAYNLDTGDYPTTEQGLQALRIRPAGLAKPDTWAGPYLDKDVPLDPWQRPFHYKYPDTHISGQPDVWSVGPDGINGTTDDIGSWMKK